MMRLALVWGWLTMLIMGTAIAATAAFAQAPAPPPTQATFAIQVIEASKGDAARLDPRLASMKKHLRPFKGQYNRFELRKARVLKLKLNATDGVDLPGKKKGRFALTLIGFTTGKVRRVRYQVEMPRTRMKRAVAKGGRTLDVIRSGEKLIIVSTVIR